MTQGIRESGQEKEMNYYLAWFVAGCLFMALLEIAAH
jgi:hypothetical protein